jgi:hypothetical protein
MRFLRAVAAPYSTEQIVNIHMAMRSYRPKAVGTFRQNGPIQNHTFEYQREIKILCKTTEVIEKPVNTVMSTFYSENLTCFIVSR